MKWDKEPFLNVVEDITSGNRKFQSAEYLTNGLYPIIDQGALSISGYTNDNNIVKRSKPIIVFGDHTKKIQYVDYDFCLGADGVKLLSTSEKVLPKYLYFFLQTVKLPDVGYSRHYKFLKECFVPIPPLHIQEHIADTLDKADALRRKNQELLTKYDELAQAIFYDMFGDPKDGLEKWGKVKLKDVCTKITDGEHGTVERLEVGKLYLMARNIRDNYIDLDEVSYISQADHNKIYTRCNPEFQDLLLVCVGATIGRASLVPNMEEFSLARSVALIKPNRLKLDPIFLYSFFKTDFMQKQIAVSGNSSAQAGLYTGKISDLELFLPPITLQKDYNKKITNILKQKSIVIKNSDNSSKLFNGSMKMYFS
jgi:type I restriction enzyme S subunit